jgi:hypothetical protein
MPGAAQCIENLYIIQQRLETASKKAVLKWGLDVQGKSLELCPVKFGYLRRSGYLKEEKNTLTEFYIRIGYTADYALKQHEMPFHHAVGQWKYLSTPFNQMSPKLISFLEEAWRKEL